ncbi:MAG: hypothetical protein D3903_21110 [Candidatus Electrothrix sp. GM3_4]|nr:hypothetical protein [Candidatus Electrothrix sp. GM3_4]
MRSTQRCEVQGGKKKRKKKAASKSAAKKVLKKLSYMDQRELDQMEEKILAAEEQHAELEAELQHPDIAGNAKKLALCCQKSEKAQQKISSLYSRWEELEALQNGD